MKLRTPWVPEYKGNVLQPLNRLAPVFENNEVPTAKHYPTWVRSAVREGASSNLKAENTLWESVLGLWRLGQVESSEEDDGEDELWTEHIRAWLVRDTSLSCMEAG